MRKGGVREGISFFASQCVLFVGFIVLFITL